MAAWDRLVCVDWGKDLTKRTAWIADVGRRRIAPLAVHPTVPELLSLARSVPGRTVIAIDAALGIPRHYLEAARLAVPEWSAATGFLPWLSLAIEHAGFLETCTSAEAWRHDRPFLSVPPGTGSLGAFWARTGGRLLRPIDSATGAKSPFIVSGIPGTVGSGTRELWRELAPLLAPPRDFAVWPFDGALSAIKQRVAMAEMYPRVCYSLALSDELPSRISALAKTSRDVRDIAVDGLQRASWVRAHGIELVDLDLARGDEDHFDAMMSAAGLLRCVLEDRPIDDRTDDDVEGGILGLASVSLGARGSRARGPRRARSSPH